MADAPQTATPQPAAVAVPKPSIEDRLAAVVGQYDEDNAAAENEDTAAAPAEGQSADSPQGQADANALTPEDLEEPAGKPQPAVEGMTIVHNGQEVALSREDAIRYAQQGFDYTRKTESLAVREREFADRVQRLSAIERVQPQVQQAKATADALALQLQRYQGVDWVALATADPLEYPKARAQYDTLVQTFQHAVGQYNQISGAVRQQQDVLYQQHLAQEAQALGQKVPEARDPQKWTKTASDIRNFLVAEGADPREVDQISSSVAVSVAYKAMLYDRLLKAKGEKVKLLRDAPPMAKPGAANTQSNQAAQDEKARARLKRSGKVEDAAAAILNRIR